MNLINDDDTTCAHCESLITEHWVNSVETAWLDESGGAGCLNSRNGHDPAVDAA